MTGRKRAQLVALLCALLVLLSGCVNNLPAEKQGTGQTLPAVRSGPEATTGDRQSPQIIRAVLYLPDVTASQLTPVTETIEIASGQTKEEAIIVRLLELVDASDFYGGTQQLRLSTVSNAVETSRDLATVNLHSSIRALSAKEQHALRVAITNTLTELPGTSYVNILINGRDIGLDVSETIPTGVMERMPGNDIEASWNQLAPERSADGGELQRMVALYFTAEDGKSLLAEVRKMTFSERSASQYARSLLVELHKGPTRIEGATSMVPPQDYFERDPVMVEAEDGANIMELYLRTEIHGYLSRQGGTAAMMLSSICYTLTSFIPKLDGITAYIGGELVTELRIDAEEGWAMQSGQMTRESMLSYAADVCKVYYPLATGKGLYAVERPIAQRHRTRPRTILRELMKPPWEEALEPALPVGITDADILGIQIQGDTALIDVSRAFAQACKGLTEAQERNMVFSIVNSLTELEGVKRVRFFVEGTQSTLSGYLFMGGEFLRNPGLIYEGAL